MKCKDRIDASPVVRRASYELERQSPHLSGIIVRKCAGIGHHITVSIIQDNTERIYSQGNRTEFTGPSMF